MITTGLDTGLNKGIYDGVALGLQKGLNANVYVQPPFGKRLFFSSLFADKSLLAYWPLDGNSNDLRGGFNGTDVNVSYIVGNGKFGTGVNGFNTLTSRIVISTGATSPMRQNAQITYSMWVYFDTGLNFRAGIADTSGNGGGGLTLNQSGVFTFSWTPTTTLGDNTFRSNLPAITTGWHHVVYSMVFTGTSVATFYLDGVAYPASITGSPVTNGVPYLNGTPYAGSQGDALGGRYVNGWTYGSCNFEDVAIFNRALTAAEVQALYLHSKS